MADLLSYTGNAGLGLGSNPNIPVSPSPNTLDVLGQTARDLASWSNQQSAMLYQQKVRDRDNMLNMIASDQIATGDMLPEYRPEVEKAINEVASIFKEWKGNPNDTEGYMKYKDAQRKASDLAKIAQVNTQQIKANRLAKAQEPISYRQKDYDEFETNEIKKGLNDIVNPYQKQLYLDADALGNDLRGGSFGEETVTAKTTTGKGKQPMSVSVTEQGQISPISKQPDKIFNYDNTLGRATMRFMERGAPAESQELLIEGFQNLGADKARTAIAGINERIREYNAQTQGKATPVSELKEGVDFVEQVDPATGQKKILIAEYTPEFAAKWALAQHPGDYVEKGAEVFNKEVGDYLNDNKKINISREKLGIDKAKANAYIENLKEKTKKLQESGVTEEEVGTIVNQFTDDFSLGNVIERTTGSKKEVVGDANVFYIDKLPTGYQNVVGPIVNAKGKLSTSKLNPFVNSVGGRPYLKGKIYNDDGTEVKTDYKSIKKAYDDSRKAGFSGTIDEYKSLIENSFKIDIQSGKKNVILEDSEGNRVSPGSIKDALKLMNNQNTKKGQEKLFTETEIDTEEE